MNIYGANVCKNSLKQIFLVKFLQKYSKLWKMFGLGLGKNKKSRSDPGLFMISALSAY
jgi:hypothetical protein